MCKVTALARGIEIDVFHVVPCRRIKSKSRPVLGWAGNQMSKREVGQSWGAAQDVRTGACRPSEDYLHVSSGASPDGDFILMKQQLVTCTHSSILRSFSNNDIE
jgi:hypothetical protein